MAEVPGGDDPSTRSSSTHQPGAALTRLESTEESVLELLETCSKAVSMISDEQCDEGSLLGLLEKYGKLVGVSGSWFISL